MRDKRASWGQAAAVARRIAGGLKAAFRPTNIVVAMVLLVVLGSALFADYQNRTLANQEARSTVSRQVVLLSARLEGNINGNLQLVRGLIATLMTEPDMAQPRFSALSKSVFEQKSQLRNIAAAPDLKISLIYPVEGNEKSIGLDYNKNEAQRAAALRARDTHSVVLAGPVNLVQGGVGFIGRFPVYVDAPNATQKFWGIVSAVVDVDKLYRDSGLTDPALGLDVTLRGRDGTGSTGPVFFGSPDVLTDHPVVADVHLPGGTWQILARPTGGWAAATQQPWAFRLGLLSAALLVLVPLFFARHLVEERARHIRTLGEREQQLQVRNAELVAATERIEHTSLHDALTHLPNRRYLDRYLSERAADAQSSGLALLHIDLDRFKQINDTLGHAAGDAMLVHAATILRDNVRDDDFVARIGGDEFVVASPLRAGGRRDLTRLANRIIEQMREPMPYMGHECRCGVSVGIAYERGKVDDRRLLVDADIALYRAKRRGRNRHEFFTEALQAEIISTKQIADDILSGIEQGQFVAWYQPQFNARTHRVSGVEALARWEHPTRGIVAPDLFLSIAEDLNVVAVIDRMILDQTLHHMQRWRELGLMIPRASVNVSARRLRDENLIRSLKKLDIPHGTISFELVESIYLDESDDVVAFNIDQIRELGIDIEIDDFGTGYASIVSLLKLQPRRLKIDRQLIMPIVESESQRQLIASIVDIGHSLGIDVIAEGVETEEHGRISTELNADELQGYAFSKPLGPRQLERFVANWQSKLEAA